MTVYIDRKFVDYVSGSLDKFSWKKDNLANCRCPLCGDCRKTRTSVEDSFMNERVPTTTSVTIVQCHFHFTPS